MKIERLYYNNQQILDVFDLEVLGAVKHLNILYGEYLDLDMICNLILGQFEKDYSIPKLFRLKVEKSLERLSRTREQLTPTCFGSLISYTSFQCGDHFFCILSSIQSLCVKTEPMENVVVCNFDNFNEVLFYDIYKDKIEFCKKTYKEITGRTPNANTTRKSK